jgi:hypothetical protein
LRDNGILAPLFKAIVQQSPRFKAQETANTLWALATLGVPATVLHENGILAPLFEAIVQQSPRFNTQNTANTLWALATLGVSINIEKDVDFLNAYFYLTKALMNMPLMQIEEIEFLQIFKAFSVFDIEPYPEQLSFFLKSNFYQYIRKQALIGINNSAQPSISQKKCHETVKALYPEWEILQEQHIPGTAEIVDIYIPEKKLIIEFNGPSHYDFMGQENIHTQNKRALLKRLGYQVINIGYQDWDRANSPKEFLCQKIDQMLMKPPKLLYQFEKQSEMNVFSNFMEPEPEAIKGMVESVQQPSTSPR